MRLQIEHLTVYRYSQTVKFGPHRLMIRPREGHDLTVESSRLEISPRHLLRWRSDLYGNSVAVVEFSEAASELRVLSRVVVHHFEPNPFNFILEKYAVKFPFRYEENELPDLQPYLQMNFPGDAGQLHAWIGADFPGGTPVPTLDLLTRLNTRVRDEFHYVRREEPGVQSPGETLALGGGSCRDYATLLMEAGRYLGLATRFVSGYVHMPDAQGHDHGATHAWTEIYLPGAGWKGFDPTGGILACDIHVPVAVARHPLDAAPLSGTFSRPGECLGMDVTVSVQELP